MTRKKRQDCQHQFEGSPNCQPAVLCIYECECGSTWQDEWSCECDDECPTCGTYVSPAKSEEIGPCACEVLK